MSDFTSEILRDLARKLDPSKRSTMSGKVLKFDGLTAHCDGFPARVGSICKIETGANTETFAEVISFRDGLNQLVVFDLAAGIRAGDRVTLIEEGQSIEVGDNLLGRVFDAMGSPLDGRHQPHAPHEWPLHGTLINPLERRHISSALDVGVKSINGLL